MMYTSMRLFSQLSRLYSFAFCTSNFCMTAASTARISTIAKAFPAQFWGPTENGMKAERFVMTSSLPMTSPVGRVYVSWLSQRSGQKVSGRGENSCGLRWSEYTWMETCAPPGTKLMRSQKNCLCTSVGRHSLGTDHGTGGAGIDGSLKTT